MTAKKRNVHLTGWHVAKELKLTHEDGRKIAPGAVFSVEGDISLCRNGLHASPTIERALGYVRNDDAPVYLSFVEVWGDVRDEGGKFCGRFRRHVAITEVSPEEQRAIYTDDNKAIEAQVAYRALTCRSGFNDNGHIQLDTVKGIKRRLYGPRREKALLALRAAKNGRKARKAA